MKTRNSNGGVQAANGFALQRNMALYLLLSEYKEKFESKKFSIYCEHHEDFLFCFYNDNNEIEFIEAYQSKKKSSTSWTLNQELLDIIKKILHCGFDLKTDESTKKTNNYYHLLFFATNQQIILKASRKNDAKTCTVNEESTEVRFNELHNEIQEKIINDVSKVENGKHLSSELKNLFFKYIDLSRTADKQEATLVGIICRLFDDNLRSPQTAIRMLTSLFISRETEYNDRNTPRLSNHNKCIDGELIHNHIEAFQKDRLKPNIENITINYEILEIRPIDINAFNMHFKSAIEYFNIQNAYPEHSQILHFTQINIDNCKTFTNESTVFELMTLYQKGSNTKLSELQLKAIFYAAVFTTINNHKETTIL